MDFREKCFVFGGVTSLTSFECPYVDKKLLYYIENFLPFAALCCLHFPGIVHWDLDVSVFPLNFYCGRAPLPDN